MNHDNTVAAAVNAYANAAASDAVFTAALARKPHPLLTVAAVVGTVVLATRGLIHVYQWVLHNVQ